MQGVGRAVKLQLRPRDCVGARVVTQSRVRRFDALTNHGVLRTIGDLIKPIGSDDARYSRGGAMDASSPIHGTLRRFVSFHAYAYAG